MRTKRIFILSVVCALACLIGVGGAVASGGKKAAKSMTECDKQGAAFQAKHGKNIAAFAAKMSRKFDADAALVAMQIVNPGQVSDAAEAEKLVRSKFKTLSPDQKQAVWLAKLSRLSEEDYTPAQWEFIQKIKGIFAGLKFDGTDDAEAFSNEIKAGKDLFGRRQLYQLFGTLKPASGDIETGRIKGAAQDGATYQKASAQVVYCNCSYFDWDDFCSWWHGQGSHCVTSSQSGCTHTFPCGWGLLGVCNGLCKN